MEFSDNLNFFNSFVFSKYLCEEIESIQEEDLN